MNTIEMCRSADRGPTMTVSGSSARSQAGLPGLDLRDLFLICGTSSYSGGQDSNLRPSGYEDGPVVRLDYVGHGFKRLRESEPTDGPPKKQLIG